MDIFDIHDEVVDRYAEYVESFLTITDDRIQDFIRRGIFDDRALWPDALLQLNLAYEKVETVEELSGTMLHPGCADIFRDEQGQSIRLYRHQKEAVSKGLAKQHFVVTSGTGSGKTLTYFLPIFDAVLRGNPTRVARLGHRRLSHERAGQLAGELRCRSWPTGIKRAWASRCPSGSRSTRARKATRRSCASSRTRRISC